MKVFVLGGDGFCGWPCAVNLADKGHDVFIVDNLSRRKIDIDLEVESLTPITSIGERIKAWSEIGGKPILWHILKIYSHYGINDFIICLGYKGYLIKEFFANYSLHTSDVTYDLKKEKIKQI